jgi:alpha-glucosidase
MEARSLFTDQTEMFMTPTQPKVGDTVTVLFRTGRYQASGVYCCVDGEKLEMQWIYDKNDFDYYSVTFGLEDEDKSSYYFELYVEGELCWYGKKGVVYVESVVTPFEIIPGFEVPEWIQGAVMYQIFVDRFRNGDPTNDVQDNEYIYLRTNAKKIENWYETPKTFDVCNFYGGDLQGVIDKLDYLKDLGIEVLYLNPVFVSPSNHKYDVQDYDHIDPHYGKILNRKNINADIKNLEASDKVFIELVEKAHERGMRVILDGVFNHCSHFNKWMDVPKNYGKRKTKDAGAYANPNSRYTSYFTFRDENNTDYECWWNNENLPKLNYEASDELYEEMMRIAEKWVSPPFNADGWRLDVAADLGHSREFNHKFWRDFRKHVKKANPEAVIIAEHYEGASEWLKGDQWDTVMNYTAFMEPVSWFLTGMEKHSDLCHYELIGNSWAFESAMTEYASEFMQPSLFATMNQLDNHDHSRFLTRTNHYVGRLNEENAVWAGLNVDKYVMRQAIVIQMTWPGAPCLYYGDEAGEVGFTDPDSRRTFPWGREDKFLTDFYKKCIGLRKEYPMLRNSSIKIIYCGYGILSYVRFDEERQIYVIISTLDNPKRIKLPVWISGRGGHIENDKLTRLLFVARGVVEYERKEKKIRYGLMDLTVRPHSAYIYLGE